MTKCAHCVWNPQKHKNIVSNAQNWKVHEINSKSTLIMTTYSRVVSWMSRRSPLCFSTSWRPGSASSKRVFQEPEKLYILYNYRKYILSEKIAVRYGQGLYRQWALSLTLSIKKTEDLELSMGPTPWKL